MLENETHSKLREFEKLGKLDNFADKYTDEVQKGDMQNMIKSYKALRKEMYAI